MAKRAKRFGARFVWNASFARRISLVAFAALAAAIAVACGLSDPNPRKEAAEQQSSAMAPGRGAVHGHVDANLKSPIPLPDAGVRLRRVSDALLTPLVKTNVHGAFIVSNVPTGTYVICLSAVGFPSTCTQTNFVVSSGRIAYPPRAVFSPQRVAIYGRVRLSDGADVRYQNDQFGKEVVTHVRALTPAGALVAGPVRANSRGQYVLGQLPPGQNYRVVAQSETISAEVAVALGTTALERNLTFPNRRPRVLELTATQNGRGVRHVEAGSKVKVEARAEDADGNPLHYRWLAPSGGSCPTTDAASVECTMPLGLGAQSIYVQVSDGIGEYETGLVRVSVGPAISRFSGKLVDIGGAPVAGAEVRVNETAVTSNSNGAFSFTVPEKNRYVLTVKKDEYQLLSKVFLAERTGATYTLLNAEKTPLDPKKDNVITVRLPKNRVSGQEGFKDVLVKISANSIVDSTGAPVTTTVNAFHSRFDHVYDTFDRMPGDYGATNPAGADLTLTSFGAIEMNLRGPAGQIYNLASGKPASLEYPIHATQLASAPASLPLWYYDEDSGLWKEDGVATRSGNSYFAQAKHFSAINVDLQKADATCVKLVVDQTKLNVPFKIRLNIPGYPVRDRDITENVTAIVRLPPNVANSKIHVLDAANNPIPNSERIFSTGDVVPAGTNLSLAAPYNECITPPSPPVTLTLDLPQNPNPTWLSRMENPGANDTERLAYATAYYDAIDADATLDDWKSRNDFTGGDDAQAYYFNAGDLEFGRSMHMNRRPDGGIAFYVTNFANADDALAGDAGDVIATVAMEYSKYPSAAAGAPRFTKFYVFDKLGNLAKSAELDNRGEKFVPGLCVVCHGGTLPDVIAEAVPPGNTESRFIPFDLKSFELSPLQPGFPADLPRGDQEENFRKLNEGVYLHTGATDAQKAMIEAWYDPLGVSTPGQTQQDGIANIPFNWSSATPADASFYYDVVRPSCRACHTSRGPGLDFGDPASISGAQFAICDSGYMPQSFVTWRNFWHSLAPRQPTRVEEYFGLGAGTCVGPE